MSQSCKSESVLVWVLYSYCGLPYATMPATIIDKLPFCGYKPVFQGTGVKSCCMGEFCVTSTPDCWHSHNWPPSPQSSHFAIPTLTCALICHNIAWLTNRKDTKAEPSCDLRECITTPTSTMWHNFVSTFRHFWFLSLWPVKVCSVRKVVGLYMFFHTGSMENACQIPFDINMTVETCWWKEEMR